MKAILAFSLLLPLVGGMLYTKSSGSNKKPEGAALSYEYRYSSTMLYPITYYRVTKEADGTVRIAWLKNHGPEVLAIRAGGEVLDRIAAISAEYKLHRLKNSYWPSIQVLDGTSWHTYLHFQKGGISSGGNNAKGPKKQMDGLQCINDYLQSLIDASSEADIIFRQDFRDYIN